VVAIGHVTWNVTIDELIPQLARGPEEQVPPSQVLPRDAPARPLKRLEDFEDG
jgi:hypothetical protein